MPINGTQTLNVEKVQLKHPKGSSIASDLGSAYKKLGSELKSKYPYKPEAEKMEYGSKGKAFSGDCYL